MFCRNCGKELCDDAFVCPSCGCLAKDLPKTEVERAPVENKKGKKIEKIALILCIVAHALSYLPSFLSFIYTPFVSYALYAELNAIINLVSYLLGFSVSVVAFVFGLIQKDKTVKIISIFTFVSGVAKGTAAFLSVITAAL